MFSAKSVTKVTLKKSDTCVYEDGQMSPMVSDVILRTDNHTNKHNQSIAPKSGRDLWATGFCMVLFTHNAMVGVLAR